MMPIAHPSDQYAQLQRDILHHGTEKEDRTGIGTISLFGYQMRFDLSKQFPLIDTKFVPFRLITEELLWFLRGETDIKPLLEKNVHIWDGDAFRFYTDGAQELLDERGLNETLETLTHDEFVEWAREEGFDLGPIYGAQWRSWRSEHHEAIDQIAGVIESIKRNPDSRRHLVSAWNPADLDDMALPPCHTLFQFYVADGKLSCQLYQRSGDVFLGVPFNIASYALLTHMIAKEVGLEVGEFIHTLGDAHIYKTHIPAVQKQLTRNPKSEPQLEIVRDVNDPAEYTFEDLVLHGYDPHPVIKAPLAT